MDLLLLIPLIALGIICFLEIKANKEKDAIIKIQQEKFRELAKKYRDTNNLRELFDIIIEHTLRYKEPPSKDQMIELLRIKGLSEKYNDIITSLYDERNAKTISK